MSDDQLTLDDTEPQPDTDPERIRWRRNIIRTTEDHDG